MPSNYKDGFKDGWNAAMEFKGYEPYDDEEYQEERQGFLRAIRPAMKTRLGQPRSKRRRSKKQQLLDSMAKKAWNQYKKSTPNGKKTYIDIRTRVSKSQDYKRKARKL